MKKFNSILLFIFIFFSCDSTDTPLKIEPIDEEEEVEAFITVSFPDNFVRPETDKLMMILSDEKGKFVDSKTYSNDNKKLVFLNYEGLGSSEKFMLTFVTSFQNTLYNLYIYSNLSKSNTGNEIVINPRGNRLSSSSVNINVPFFQDGNIINAAGDGYSMVRLSGNSIEGHYTPQYTNNLGPNKVFVKYYDPFDPYKYSWALIPNIKDVSTLNETDLKKDNVVVRQLSTNVVTELPLLQIQGFDNETLFNVISGHRIFDDYLQNFGYSSNHYYSYPDIFYNTVYSLAFSKYSLFGVGLPPSEVNIPNEEVNATIADKKIIFEGINDYEVGRIQLTGPDVGITIIFDGTSNSINLPEIPLDVLPIGVTHTVNNVNVNLVQVVAENYKSFNDYGDYISNVVKTSTPFYVNSPERERVFKSFVGPQIYPMTEFPYFTSFR